MMRRDESRPLNLLDSCIQAEFKMLDRDLELGLILAFALFGLGLSWILIFLIIPAIIAAAIYFYHVLGKLFSKSIFGKDAVLYRSLPVPTGYLVFSKIYTAGTIFIIFWLAAFGGHLMMSLFMGNFADQALGLFASMLEKLLDAGAAESMLPVYVVLLFIEGLVFNYTAAAFIFLLVTGYMTRPEAERTYMFQTVLFFLGMFGLVILALGPVALHTLFWEEYNLWLPMMQLAVNIIAILLSAGLSARLVERKDKGV